VCLSASAPNPSSSSCSPAALSTITSTNSPIDPSATETMGGLTSEVQPAAMMSQSQHRGRNSAELELGYRRRGLVKHQEPGPGDLLCQRPTVPHREERIAATVHDQRRHCELSEALPPAWPTVESREHEPQLIGHVHVRKFVRRAVPDAFGDRPRGGGIVSKD